MSEMQLEGKIIAVDFDSTISHCPEWRGPGVFGKPVESAKWALDMFKEMGAMIIVHTCRAETFLVKEYLNKHKIPFDYINYSPRNAKWKLSDKKIAADIYIDDKGIEFRGSWMHTYLAVVNFMTWEKKESMNAISGK